MGESIITDPEFIEKKYWFVELCQLRKKWHIDFSLSVTKGNVLSVKGRIDGLFLFVIKVKRLKEKYGNWTEKNCLC